MDRETGRRRTGRRPTWTSLLGRHRSSKSRRIDPSDEMFLVPPEDLRWRVTGLREPELSFRQQGQDSLNDLERALRYTGRTIASFVKVLDFGCGCGRVLRHLGNIADRVSLHGCDIDSQAVEWAAGNLPFATFICNDRLPPLPYNDCAFDLIINHSVFTHLPEDYQDAWLGELRRIVCPGGFLVLSVAGPHAFAGLVQSWIGWPRDPAPIQETMRDKGFLYIADDSWQGTCFPDFYHSAFHSPSYIVEHWGQYLTVLAYLPRAALGFQDLVVLRRESDDAHRASDRSY